MLSAALVINALMFAIDGSMNWDSIARTSAHAQCGARRQR
jgi:hypothetical protein